MRGRKREMIGRQSMKREERKGKMKELNKRGGDKRKEAKKNGRKGREKKRWREKIGRRIQGGGGRGRRYEFRMVKEDSLRRKERRMDNKRRRKVSRLCFVVSLA